MAPFLLKTGARLSCFSFRSGIRFPEWQVNQVLDTIKHRHFTTASSEEASSNAVYGASFSKWAGAVYGQHGARMSHNYWDNVGKISLFRRSMGTMNTKVDRRKRDLARREFQLLRKKTKLMKATMAPEERLSWRLKKANRKKAILLQRLKKYELEEDPEPVHDPELITPEQLQALKKIGYKNRNYVPVGRRGVYGGVVQNMHMHWKFHETVQVDCHIFKREDIRSIARELAVLSGGIVIDIHQGTTIIMYRGRNYKQPKTEMIPPNTLTKRKALFKSKILQALDGLNTNIQNIESELQMILKKQKENASKENTVEKKEVAQEMKEVAKEKAGNAIVPDTYMNVSTDDDSEDDDGIFSWDSDSLDEDELSEDEKLDLPKKTIEEKKQQDTISWTDENSSKQGEKKKAQTAKELVQAEQQLFQEGQNRTIKMKKGFDLIEEESDDNADGNEKRTVAPRHRQPRNKKIARFLNDYNKDNQDKDDEEDKFETDFSEADEYNEVGSHSGDLDGSDVTRSHSQPRNKKIASFLHSFNKNDENEKGDKFETDSREDSEDNEFGSDFGSDHESEYTEDDTDFNDLDNQSNDTKGKN